MQSNIEELQLTKKQFETSEHARDILTTKVLELTEKMDSTNNQFSELCKERDSLQRTLEGVRNEKHHVDKEKAELNLMMDMMTGDYEKLQASKSNLQKITDNLNEEKKMLELDLQCVMKDKEITEMNLR